jgi:hypothetical protein
MMGGASRDVDDTLAHPLRGRLRERGVHEHEHERARRQMFAGRDHGVLQRRHAQRPSPRTAGTSSRSSVRPEQRALHCSAIAPSDAPAGASESRDTGVCPRGPVVERAQRLVDRREADRIPVLARADPILARVRFPICWLVRLFVATRQAKAVLWSWQLVRCPRGER